MVGCISLADLALPTIFFWSCGQVVKQRSSAGAAHPYNNNQYSIKPNLLTYLFDFVMMRI
jgi:hypothetical protein